MTKTVNLASVQVVYIVYHIIIITTQASSSVTSSEDRTHFCNKIKLIIISLEGVYINFHIAIVQHNIKLLFPNEAFILVTMFRWVKHKFQVQKYVEINNCFISIWLFVRTILMQNSSILFQ